MNIKTYNKIDSMFIDGIDDKILICGTCLLKNEIETLCPDKYILLKNSNIIKVIESQTDESGNGDGSACNEAQTRFSWSLDNANPGQDANKYEVIAIFSNGYGFKLRERENNAQPCDNFVEIHSIDIFDYIEINNCCLKDQQLIIEGSLLEMASLEIIYPDFLLVRTGDNQYRQIPIIYLEAKGIENSRPLLFCAQFIPAPNEMEYLKKNSENIANDIKIIPQIKNDVDSHIETNIIENELREKFNFSEVVSSGLYARAEEDALSVVWLLTEGCNYRCPYCGCKKTFGKFHSKEQLFKAADTLFALNRPAYDFTIFGGEPTYHPNCADLMKYISSKAVPTRIFLITNGSQKVAYYQDLIRDTGLNRIVLSLHLHQVKIGHFIDVLKACVDLGCNVMINFMIVPEKFDEARKYADMLVDLRATYPFHVQISQVWDKNGIVGVGITDEHRNFISNLDTTLKSFIPGPYKEKPALCRYENDLVIERQGKSIALSRDFAREYFDTHQSPVFENYYCLSGSNVFHIYEDGRIGGGCCQAAAMTGNIYTDSPETIINGMKAVKCNLNACHCPDNLPIPKFKYASDAQKCVDDLKARYLAYL